MNYYSLILALLSLAGFAVMIWGIIGWLQTKKQRAWPNTQGSITHASAGDDLLPDIRYRYQVSGKEYNNQLRLPPATEPSEELNQSLLKRYPAGSPVDVRYDPDTPDNASIGEGDHAADWLIIAIGLLGFLFGTYALLR